MTWGAKKLALCWIILLLNLATSPSSHSQSRFVTTRGKDLIAHGRQTAPVERHQSRQLAAA